MKEIKREANVDHKEEEILKRDVNQMPEMQMKEEIVLEKKCTNHEFSFPLWMVSQSY